jgi:hypothetical protein
MHIIAQSSALSTLPDARASYRHHLSPIRGSEREPVYNNLFSALQHGRHFARLKGIIVLEIQPAACDKQRAGLP